MSVHLDVRNESACKRLYRRESLRRLAARVCAGEGVRGPAEVSLLLCDDDRMQALNKRYRGKNAPTDVLAFGQARSRAARDSPAGSAVRVLGDVVVSLETVQRRCGGDRERMRVELAVLFCHGLLHVLGYDHATPRGRAAMEVKQAGYLGPKAMAAGPSARRAGRGGGGAHSG